MKEALKRKKGCSLLMIPEFHGSGCNFFKVYLVIVLWYR